MHIFSIVFFSVLFSVNSKFVNLNLFRSLDDLKLNKMVGQNGVFNQQGSILQMALKQNGEHDKALNSFSKARLLPWFAIIRISANNLPNYSDLKDGVDNCLTIAAEEKSSYANDCLLMLFNNDYFWS